jgi:hypothetical protein
MGSVESAIAPIFSLGVQSEYSRLQSQFDKSRKRLASFSSA